MPVRECEALSIAYEVLANTGLANAGWSFRFNNNKTRSGVCRFRNRSIELSRYALLKDIDSVRNTITHEAAHAIVGPTHGHDGVWRSKHIQLGGNGQRCGVGTEGLRENIAKYVGICPNGHKHYRHRRPSGASSCLTCHPRYNVAYLVRWENNVVRGG